MSVITYATVDIRSLATAFLMWLPGISGDERPDALSRAVEARSSIRSALISGTQRTPQHFTGVRSFDAMAAGGEYGWTFGVTPGSESPTGADGLPSDQYPGTFAIGEYTWAVRPGDIQSDAWPSNERPLIDVRTLGLTASPVSGDAHDVVWRGHRQRMAPARRYDARRDGAVHIVRAADGEVVTTWRIDANKGWNPVGVTLEMAGEVIAESRVELHQFGENWFPSRAEYFRKGYMSGREAAEVLEIHSAVFNDPSLPEFLTPGDIGVDVGHTILLRRVGQTESFGWDGRELVPSQEFNTRLVSGEVVLGRRFLENAARLTAMDRAWRESRRSAPQPTTVSLSEWERYTLDFIARHGLSEEQRQVALRVLRRCQDEAAQVARGISGKLKTLDDEERAARSLPETVRSSKLVLLAQHRTKLLAPVESIFETRLKPGLEKIPTRAQKLAAEAARSRRP
ncbi:MAG TPA: hypothetical protein VNL96_05880 [Gemmatimonadaceae bacterium]|nr:hypothetical protein [Gemmatimonadaceae bacterium]